MLQNGDHFSTLDQISVSQEDRLSQNAKVLFWMELLLHNVENRKANFVLDSEPGIDFGCFLVLPAHLLIAKNGFNTSVFLEACVKNLGK